MHREHEIETDTEPPQTAFTIRMISLKWRTGRYSPRTATCRAVGHTRTGTINIPRRDAARGAKSSISPVVYPIRDHTSCVRIGRRAIITKKLVRIVRIKANRFFWPISMSAGRTNKIIQKHRRFVLFNQQILPCHATHKHCILYGSRN